MLTKDNFWVMTSILFFALTKIVALISAAVIAVKGNVWVGAALFIGAIVFRIQWTFTPSEKQMDKIHEKANKAALSEAVTALYLDDSSDYKSALWKIVEITGGSGAVELLENDEERAYRTYAGKKD